MKVSVIIVTYCSKDEIAECINSVYNQGIELETFIVDNASDDGTQEIIVNLSKEFCKFNYILNDVNKGLAYANNQPLNVVSGEYVLILNPDTILADGSLSRMVSFLDSHKTAAVVGAKSLYTDGSPHTSYHYSWNYFHVIVWRVLFPGLARTLYDKFAKYKFASVLFVSGACLLVRTDLFMEIGGYDPEFFLTVEDACDVCVRIKKLNRDVYYLPEAIVTHMGGRSSVSVKELTLWHGYRGSIYYFYKHYGVLHAYLLSAIILVSILCRFPLFLLFSIFSVNYRIKNKIYMRLFVRLLQENPIRHRLF